MVNDCYSEYMQFLQIIWTGSIVNREMHKRNEQEFYERRNMITQTACGKRFNPISSQKTTFENNKYFYPTVLHTL